MTRTPRRMLARMRLPTGAMRGILPNLVLHGAEHGGRGLRHFSKDVATGARGSLGASRMARR